MLRPVRNIIAGVATLGLSTVAAGMMLATPASADSTSGNYASECGSTYYCVWYASNDKGSKYQFSGNNTSWDSWAINNNDSSSYNKGTSRLGVNLYGNAYYSWKLGCSSYHEYWSLHNPNDTGESNQWTSAC